MRKLLTIIILLSSLSAVIAQSNFSFNYSGPQNLTVDQNCKAILDWGHPNSVTVTSNIPGSFIISFELQSISGGYQIGDTLDVNTSVTIVYIAVDNMGNWATFGFVLTALDETPPEFTSTLPEDITITCVDELTTPTLEAIDNCANPSNPVAVIFSTTPVLSPCEGGVINRTWTALDPNGNQTVHNQEVAVTADVIAPFVIVPPMSGESDCENAMQDYLIWLETQRVQFEVFDIGCGIDSLYDDAPDPSEIGALCGVIDINFYAVDNCQNTTTVEVTYEIDDEAPPELISPAVSRQTDCASPSSMSLFQQWIDMHGEMEILDDCGNITWTTDPPSPQIGGSCTDSVEVTFTATDGCGNSVSSTASYFLTDTVPPVMINPPVVGIGNCTGNLDSMIYDYIDTLGNLGVVDYCTDNQDLIVEYIFDGELASIEEIRDALLDSVGTCRTVEYNEQEYDQVISWVTFSFLISDQCGNGLEIPAAVIVLDTIGPEINVFADDLYLDCSLSTDSISALVTDWYNEGGNTAGQDDCSSNSLSPSISLENLLDTISVIPGNSCVNDTVFSVNFNLVDICGNLSSNPNPGRIIRTDTTAPVVIFPSQDLIISCDEYSQDSLQSWIDNSGNALVVDGCGNTIWFEFEFVSINGSTFSGTIGSGPYPYLAEIGCDATIPFTFRVMDPCGNITETMANFILVDVSPPEFEPFPQDTILSCQSSFIPDEVTAIDVCQTAVEVMYTDSTNQSQDSTSCDFYNYTLFRYYTAIDSCGNMSDTVQRIHFADTLAPEIVAPAELTVSCDTYVFNQPFGSYSVIDNCTGMPEIHVQDSIIQPDCDQIINRSWTVTDHCGNIAEFEQLITIIDTVPPELNQPPSDQSISCENGMDAEAAYTEWLAEAGFALWSDDCGQTEFFAAIPDSYDPEDPSTFPGEAPKVFSICEEDIPGILFTSEVDFVFLDACGNLVSRNAIFELTDSIPAEVLLCPGNVTYYLPEGSCEGVYYLLPPIISENCGNDVQPYNNNDQVMVNSADPGNSNIPVDPVYLSFNAPVAPSVFMEPAQLSITIVNVDAESTEEYFIIKAEDGTILGTTNLSATQCDSSNTIISGIDPSLLNNWAVDGELNFVLEPFVNPGLGGSFAINDICSGTEVFAEISSSIQTPQNLSASFSINGSVIQESSGFFGDTVVLVAGTHQIDYFITDCAGNMAICSYTVQMRDGSPPTFICPESISDTLSGTNCEKGIILSPPDSISDDCNDINAQMFTAPQNANEAFITYYLHPNINQFVAQPKSIAFNLGGFIAIDDAKLEIDIQADINDSEDFFYIYTENNSLLGDTKTSFGGCDTTIKFTLSIPLDSLNSWAADGIVEFLFQPFDNFIAPYSPDDGINPCNGSVSQNGDNDGLSTINAKITFPGAELYYFIQGATEITLTPWANGGQPFTQVFQSGNSDVGYVVYDVSGNSDTCFYSVNLMDIEPPVAICKNVVINIHPSGEYPHELIPEDIDDGSSDNCQLKDLRVTPIVFNCAEAGNEYDVWLIAEDASGNIDSCLAFVKVAIEELKPQYSIELCQADTLHLFANMPPPASNVYTFNWTGPNGFSSSDKNPVIPNASAANSGTYSLNVTGLSGCVSGGSVMVLIENLSTPTVTPEEEIICEFGSVVLQTIAYSGTVTYEWYQGQAPTGVLIETTTDPTLIIPGLPQGNYSYYVIVQGSTCTSNPSPSVEVEVILQPIPDIIYEAEICAGEDIELSTNFNVPGVTYNWWGPDGFNSDQQFPPVISMAGNQQEGTYYLEVSIGGCKSEAIPAAISIIPTPDQPEISGTDSVCIGSELILQVNNVPDADAFEWVFPAGNSVIIPSNIFSVSVADQIHDGQWQVIAISNDCPSIPSVAWDVNLLPLPQFEIVVDTPVCSADSLYLSTDFIGVANYIWEGPSNYSSTSPNPVTEALEGTYSLILTDNNNCSFENDIQITTGISPEITALSASDSICSDGTATIRLEPTVFPGNIDLEYEWWGPSAFSSEDTAAIITNATSTLSGTYYLTVWNESCSSGIDSIEVVIFDEPAQPLISSELNYCEGDSILIITDPFIAEPVSYEWHIPGGVISSDEPELLITSATSASNGEYFVILVTEHCQSYPSDTLSINIFTPPPQPEILAPDKVCEGDSLVLEVTNINGGNYSWSGPNVFFSDEEIVTIFPATLDKEGIYTVHVEKNGCESIESEAVFVDILALPPSPLLTIDQAGICADYAEAEFTVCVDEITAVPGATYQFFLSPGDVPITTPEAVLCQVIDDFTNIEEGLYGIYALSEVEGCGSASSIPVQIEISRIPEESADAGTDFSICNEGDLKLDALAPFFSIGEWISSNQETTFQNLNDPKTGISEISVGENQFIWSISHGFCFDYSRDTVLAFLESSPQAINDSYITPFGKQQLLDHLNNDNLASGSYFEVVSGPSNGSITRKNNGDYVYIPNINFIGNDFLIYRICLENCPEICDEARIDIQVGDETLCDIPTIFTPNQDGINDRLIVQCLINEQYPDNKVVIFNIYGDEVFSAAPYLNDWDGTWNGNDLPAATYYYYVDFGNGQTPETGFIIIER
jgi:gliding motility-associated-like protein